MRTYQTKKTTSVKIFTPRDFPSVGTLPALENMEPKVQNKINNSLKRSTDTAEDQPKSKPRLDKNQCPLAPNKKQSLKDILASGNQQDISYLKEILDKLTDFQSAGYMINFRLELPSWPEKDLNRFVNWIKLMNFEEVKMNIYQYTDPIENLQTAFLGVLQDSRTRSLSYTSVQPSPKVIDTRPRSQTNTISIDTTNYRDFDSENSSEYGTPRPLIGFPLDPSSTRSYSQPSPCPEDLLQGFANTLSVSSPGLNRPGSSSDSRDGDESTRNRCNSISADITIGLAKSTLNDYVPEPILQSEMLDDISSEVSTALDEEEFEQRTGVEIDEDNLNEMPLEYPIGSENKESAFNSKFHSGLSNIPENAVVTHFDPVSDVLHLHGTPPSSPKHSKYEDCNIKDFPLVSSSQNISERNKARKTQTLPIYPNHHSTPVNRNLEDFTPGPKFSKSHTLPCADYATPQSRVQSLEGWLKSHPANEAFLLNLRNLLNSFPPDIINPSLPSSTNSPTDGIAILESKPLPIPSLTRVQTAPNFNLSSSQDGKIRYSLTKNTASSDDISSICSQKHEFSFMRRLGNPCENDDSFNIGDSDFRIGSISMYSPDQNHSIIENRIDSLRGSESLLNVHSTDEMETAEYPVLNDSLVSNSRRRKQLLGKAKSRRMSTNFLKVNNKDSDGIVLATPEISLLNASLFDSSAVSDGISTSDRRSSLAFQPTSPGENDDLFLNEKNCFEDDFLQMEDFQTIEEPDFEDVDLAINNFTYLTSDSRNLGNNKLKVDKAKFRRNAIVVGGKFQKSFDNQIPVISPPSKFDNRITDLRIINGNLEIQILSPHRQSSEWVNLGINWVWLPASPVGFLIVNHDHWKTSSNPVFYYLLRHPLQWNNPEVHYFQPSSDLTISASHNLLNQIIEIVTISSNVFSFLTPKELYNSCLLVNKTWSIVTSRILIRDFNKKMWNSKGVKKPKAKSNSSQARSLSSESYLLFMQKYAAGMFINEGACKRVYCVQQTNNNSLLSCSPNSTEYSKTMYAVSIMDILDLKQRGMEQNICQEIEISMLCSRLFSLNICPNMLHINNLFQSEFTIPNNVWTSNHLTPSKTPIAKSVDNLKSFPKGLYQYIQMEYCAGGDMEEHVRRCGEQLLDINTIRLYLFQFFYSLYVGRERFSLIHYDIKLLNFFLTNESSLHHYKKSRLFSKANKSSNNSSQTNIFSSPISYFNKLSSSFSLFQSSPSTDSNFSSSNQIPLYIGFDSNLYELPVNVTKFPIIKLADFGTSIIEAESIPITVQQFTTLENTPPELLLLGSSARQSFSYDTFQLGLCFLHLLTGHEPYEELLKDVKCPTYLFNSLKSIWNIKKSDKKNPYFVIMEVIESLDYDPEDPESQDISSVLYDTLYRYVVLFGSSGNFNTGFLNSDLYRNNPVMKTLIKSLNLLPSTDTYSRRIRATNNDKLLEKCIEQYNHDKSKWSFHVGNSRIMEMARIRLQNLGRNSVELFDNLLHWDPSQRISMYEALNHPIFDSFKKSTPQSSPSISYMHYYRNQTSTTNNKLPIF